MAANVTFIETTSALLASLPISDGAIIYVTDTQLLYRDVEGERVLLNSPIALKLAYPRTIELINDVAGSAEFDGSKNIEIDVQLKNSGIIPGNYGPTESRELSYGDSFEVPQFAIDAKGRIIAGTGKFFTLPKESGGANSTLYDSTGTATDGAMTQKATTESLNALTKEINQTENRVNQQLIEYAEYWEEMFEDIQMGSSQRIIISDTKPEINTNDLWLQVE